MLGALAPPCLALHPREKRHPKKGDYMEQKWGPFFPPPTALLLNLINGHPPLLIFIANILSLAPYHRRIPHWRRTAPGGRCCPGPPKTRKMTSPPSSSSSSSSSLSWRDRPSRPRPPPRWRRRRSRPPPRESPGSLRRADDNNELVHVVSTATKGRRRCIISG